MKTLVRLAVAILVIGAVFGGAVGDRIWGYKILDKYWPRLKTQELQNSKTQIVTEENVVIEVAEKVSPSVVTVGIKKTQIFREIDPFDFFGMGRIQQKKVEQDIGTGFILTEDGLVVTNKHVVGDTQATYKIVTKDDKTYEVQKIYRDPANDLAILKVDAKELKPVELGDSSKLKVGQMVIAIGTALGEFRHTVTTGVVSGLGRGITAGSPLEGAVERLDNVIQTDAAINPGNSGGPLLNSSGQVIGVNTAISPEGQNIGFAIPINVIKDAIDNFNKTGQFSRPYLGVRYRIKPRY
ncbi:MAG: protease Do [Candidatus Amesbacteria bacterium GW2011_GWA1_47_20]|uniref:Protease Do n=1 Tax=Candidatus Amesbacteria bacterium GW2011_GWA1_47_20 TaxID=1618354 RepID=A0A0G1SL56_9BACT|nr:MAG: protease Do [Candidatus Amesbacteria bacterium GW2011_GWA1_47_20]